MKATTQASEFLGGTTGRMLLLAWLIAALASTQYLVQPFVWRNWPVDEVLLGWLEVLVARIVPASAIALTVAVALAKAPEKLRAAAVVCAIPVGALGGVALQFAFSTPYAPPSKIAWFADIGRWSLVGWAVAGLYFARQRTLAADRARRDAVHAERAAAGQAAALRLPARDAQIEGHFLFNTFARLRRLGVTEPAQFERLLDDLYTFVRLMHAAPQGHGSWPLANEVALARTYLGVVKLRLSERLSLRFDVDASLSACPVPPLALATLVENAVKHGITPAPAGGEIMLWARRSANGDLDLGVADTGVGLREGGGAGIGLANTRERLRSLYGAAGRLTLEANLPSGVIARVRLPPQARGTQ